MEDLRGLSEIDRHRRKVEGRWAAEAAPGCGRKKIEDFVAVVSVTPEAGTAAAERGQRQFGDVAANLAATIASTALPPRRSRRAPASAVCGSDAAMTPRMLIRGEYAMAVC
jgi:hypothetical protein